MVDKVKVSKAKLLKVLTANRKQHLEDFTAAFSVYKEESQAAFIQAVTSRGQVGPWENSVELDDDEYPVPRNYVEEYDTAIGMLEFSVDNAIYIDHNDYKRYVQNNWSWKESFHVTNSHYISIKDTK